MCENVPEEIAKKGKELRSNLLPLKSKNAYEKVYVSFQDWKNKNRIKEVTEDVILAFLDMRVSTYLVYIIHKTKLFNNYSRKSCHLVLYGQNIQC